MSKQTISSLMGCAVLFALISCSDEETTGTYLELTALPEIHPEPQLSITDTDDFFFGGISSVTTDSRGNIYVSDREKVQIFVFNDQGQFTGTFGEQGEGPGEFERVDKISTRLNDDTLFVYDGYYDDIHVFVPGDELPELSHEFNARVLDKPNVRDIYPIGNHQILTTFGLFGGVDAGDGKYSALLNSYGEVLEHDFRFVHRDDVIIREDGGMTMFIQQPYGSQALLSVGPDDRIYYAWSKNPTIETITKTGELVDSIKIALPNRETTPELLEDYIDDFDFRDEVEGYIREEFPETKPVFRDLIVDDQNYIWLKIYPDSSTDPNWLILDENREPIATTTFSDNFSIEEIRNNRIYGFYSPDENMNRINYEVKTYSYSFE